MAFLLTGAGVSRAAEFLEPDAAFPVRVESVERTWFVVFDVAPGYYLYRDKLSVKPLVSEADGGAAGAPVIADWSVNIPAGVRKFDENLNKEVETLRGEVRLSLSWSGAGPSSVEIGSQGCADAGLCYPPQTKVLRLMSSGAGGDRAGAVSKAGINKPVADEAGALAQTLGSGRWLVVLPVFFGLGVLLAFTPCVLPMVPILSAVVVGQQARGDRWRSLRLALAYVLGMSLVYTLVGIAAGLSGQGLVAALQTPWVLFLFAAGLFVFGVSMLGAYDLQLPLAVQNWVNARSAGLEGGRYGSVALMGGLSAVLVGPCVAPPLAGALLYLSTTGDWVLGGLALMALSWGLGAPLLVAAGAAGQVLPKAGPWMESVKRFFGFLLIALAIYTAAPVISARVLMALWSVFLLISAAWAGALQVLPEGAGAWPRLRQGAAWVLLLCGLMQGVGAGLGADDVFQPLAPLRASGGAPIGTMGAGSSDAAASAAHGLPFVRIAADQLDTELARDKRPAFLDFYADWCVACKEMERFTFSDPRVQRALSGVRWLQVDVTDNTPADQALLKRFRLFGPPGIVFFDAQGLEIADARVVGFQNAERFLQTLNAVYGSTQN